MGAWYHLVNHSKKEYTQSLGKLGEFCSESVCFILGWMEDDVDMVSEHDIHEVIYDHEVDEYIYGWVGAPCESLVCVQVVNITREEYHEFPSWFLLDDQERVIHRFPKWSLADKIIFSGPSNMSHEYRNISRSEWYGYEVDLDSLPLELYKKVTPIHIPKWSKFGGDIDILCV
jgi:hypothetical protein